MEFKDGKTYKIKLLKDVGGYYDINYGKTGDIIELRHQKRYGHGFGQICVIEGHGYGTTFKLGQDFELVKEEE